MPSRTSTSLLVLTLLVAIALVSSAEHWALERQDLQYIGRMHKAEQLCAEWFEVVSDYKSEHGITTDSRTATHYREMIGDEFTVTTTTLGSLESKETSANPAFAALLLRWYMEAGLDSAATIGLVLSGSFPSLGVASLAAAQVLGVRVVLISSLGASTYGANQLDATWLDIESALRDRAGMSVASSLVTLGAENDRGEGMLEEGVEALRLSAERNGVPLYEPASLGESIDHKTDLLRREQISLLVNIGGNQAALGRCPHAAIIPTGLHRDWHGCDDSLRGIVTRIAQDGIPFAHLLNIKQIADSYGIPISPGTTIAMATNLYTTRTVYRTRVALSLLLLLGFLIAGRMWGQRSSRAHIAHIGRNENSAARGKTRK